MPETSYPPDYVANLEMQWGAGFLSPGGREEVLEILRDFEIEGKVVLDIGCGTGGPDIVIASTLNPEKIIGIDVEPNLVEQGKRNVEKADLQHLVELQLVEPGPLPFPSESVGVVFSKDSLIHVEDKKALYCEILRVLKPGGIFAASDWLVGENAANLDGYKRWLALTAHSFTMQTSDETRGELVAAGFEDIVLRDRNEWYAETAMQEVRMMEGDEWKGRFVAAFDEERYEKKLALREANAQAAQCGGLRPTHLFGKRSEI